MHPPVSCLGRT